MTLVVLHKAQSDTQIRGRFSIFERDNVWPWMKGVVSLGSQVAVKMLIGQQLRNSCYNRQLRFHLLRPYETEYNATNIIYPAEVIPPRSVEHNIGRTIWGNHFKCMKCNPKTTRHISHILIPYQVIQSFWKEGAREPYVLAPWPESLLQLYSSGFRYQLQ